MIILITTRTIDSDGMRIYKAQTAVLVSEESRHVGKCNIRKR